MLQRPTQYTLLLGRLLLMMKKFKISMRKWNSKSSRKKSNFPWRWVVIVGMDSAPTSIGFKFILDMEWELTKYVSQQSKKKTAFTLLLLLNWSCLYSFQLHDFPTDLSMTQCIVLAAWHTVPAHILLKTSWEILLHCIIDTTSEYS